MKNGFKQLGKALCYFGAYMICQLIATIGFVFGTQFVMSFMAGARGETNIDVEQIQQAASDLLLNNMGIVLLINAALAMTVFLIVMSIRKHKFTEEVSINKVSAKIIVLTVVAAFGSRWFLNYGMDFLPLPESLVQSMSNGNASLGAIPIWQSILATCIVVPIMEEIVFRGFVFSRLDKAMPTAVAVIITSILFGVIHGSVLWAAWAGLVGAVLNIIRIKTGSLVPSIIAHIINNSVSTILQHTGNSFLDGYKLPLVIIGAVLLIGAITLMDRESKKNVEKTEVEIITTAA